MEMLEHDWKSIRIPHDDFIYVCKRCGACVHVFWEHNLPDGSKKQIPIGAELNCNDEIIKRILES
jgi:hypothetical protein